VKSYNTFDYRHPGDRTLPRTLFYIGPLLVLTLSLLACNTNPRISEEGIANLDPITAGSVEAEFPKSFSSTIEKKKVDVIFEPRTNMVYLEFKYQTVTYRQYWNQENRARFREALEKYKADYEAKKLVDKPYRTRRAYGNLKGLVHWGYPFNINVTILRLSSMGYPNYEIGYLFKRDSDRRETPYFTIFQRETDDVLKDNNARESRSTNIFVYYTRAQAEDLANIFDQQYLLSLTRTIPAGDLTPDVDTY
jgi:hypothetical protein